MAVDDYMPPDYFLDNYGECLAPERCATKGVGCLRTTWKGRLCPYWKPLGITSWQELLCYARNKEKPGAAAGLPHSSL